VILMLGLSCKTTALAVLGLVLLALLVWFYSQRVKPVQLTNYVPDSALGYLEINSVPQVLKQLTATTAWKQLAPAYGLTDKLNYAGALGGLAQFAGALGGETTLAMLTGGLVPMLGQVTVDLT